MDSLHRQEPQVDIFVVPRVKVRFNGAIECWPRGLAEREERTIDDAGYYVLKAPERGHRIGDYKVYWSDEPFESYRVGAALVPMGRVRGDDLLWGEALMSCGWQEDYQHPIDEDSQDHLNVWLLRLSGLVEVLGGTKVAMYYKGTFQSGYHYNGDWYYWHVDFYVRFNGDEEGDYQHFRLHSIQYPFQWREARWDDSMEHFGVVRWHYDPMASADPWDVRTR